MHGNAVHFLIQKQFHNVQHFIAGGEARDMDDALQAVFDGAFGNVQDLRDIEVFVAADDELEQVNVNGIAGGEYLFRAEDPGDAGVAVEAGRHTGGGGCGAERLGDDGEIVGGVADDELAAHLNADT